MENQIGFVVAASAEELDILLTGDMTRKLFLLCPGEYQIVGTLVSVGDFVKFDEGNIIRKTENNGDIDVRHLIEGGRERIELSVYFVPLYFSLFPATAKAKNLVLAYTDKLGSVPITKGNNYMKHCIYNGHAIYYPKKTRDEIVIEGVYSTGWFLYGDKGERASLEQIQQNFQFEKGVILDSSLKDVFMVFNEDYGLVSLRKEICIGLEIGDWIEFVYLEVDEAEKSDENMRIYPDQQDEMTFFHNRKVALSPVKIEPMYTTTAVSDRQIQIIHKLQAPNNATQQVAYNIQGLGNVKDESGLIGVKHGELTVAILSRIANFQFVEFVIVDVLEPKGKLHTKPPSPQELPAKAGGFLEGIDRASQARHTHLAPTAPTRIPLSTVVNGGVHQQQSHQPKPVEPHQPKPVEVEPQQQHSDESLGPTDPPIKIKRPSNSISINGIVVEKVTDRRNDSYILAFSNDMALRNKIVRIMCHDIETSESMPKIGNWLEIIMKKNVHSRHASTDYTVWSAKKRNNIYETEIKADAIWVRVQLKINGDSTLYNKDLGMVLNKGLDIPTGNEMKTVLVWCTHMKAPVNEHYWQIAPTPDPVWQDVHSPTNRRQNYISPVPTTIGYIGSRYRKKEGETSEGKTVEVVLQTERPVTSQPVAEQFHVVNDAPQQEEVGMDMSGERMADESVPPSSPEQLEDLIDLHEEPAHQQLSQEEEDMRYTGVVASIDRNTGGFYIYTNELRDEVFLPVSPEWQNLKKATWINFNLVANRSIVSEFRFAASPPFVIAMEERNTISMIVRATIDSNYDLAKRIITTEYVPMVYDIKNLITPAHRGRTVRLKVLRRRLPQNPWKWEISSVEITSD